MRNQGLSVRRPQDEIDDVFTLLTNPEALGISKSTLVRFLGPNCGPSRDVGEIDLYPANKYLSSAYAEANLGTYNYDGIATICLDPGSPEAGSLYFSTDDEQENELRRRVVINLWKLEELDLISFLITVSQIDKKLEIY
jgi:hypothetical protein